MRRIASISLFFVLAIALMSLTIDLNHLDNYANQTKPAYITKDNTLDNSITDAGATLGRVLFYDKKLSVDNTIACASCHRQQFAFSDTSIASTGVNGTTARHAMRLINARFAVERKFFWDERAASLEIQTTMPIQNHAEMGYSGADGDPAFTDLLEKLDAVPYYKPLFNLAFGDTVITEERIQKALAQFVRSIQSFDSKFDAGRSQVPNEMANFPNFSPAENSGKALFLMPPVFNANGERINGGAGCAGCHAAPEFDINPASRNNGFITAIDGGLDPGITRAPSLRDVVKSNGSLNGPLMHHGGVNSLAMVIEHYNNIDAGSLNPNLDPKLRPNGFGQKLNLTNQEKNALIAFIRTLAGTDVYVNPKWSNPFDADGNIDLVGTTTASTDPKIDAADFRLYPNPAVDACTVAGALQNTEIHLLNSTGQTLQVINPDNDAAVSVDITALPKGIYFIVVRHKDTDQRIVKKLVRQ